MTSQRAPMCKEAPGLSCSSQRLTIAFASRSYRTASASVARTVVIVAIGAFAQVLRMGQGRFDQLLQFGASHIRQAEKSGHHGDVKGDYEGPHGWRRPLESPDLARNGAVRSGSSPMLRAALLRGSCSPMDSHPTQLQVSFAMASPRRDASP